MRQRELEQYYRALELEVGASLDEINQAYRDLAFIWHPDRIPNDRPRLLEKAAAKLKEINTARDRLRTLNINGSKSRNSRQNLPHQQPDIAPIRHRTMGKGRSSSTQNGNKSAQNGNKSTSTHSQQKKTTQQAHRQQSKQSARSQQTAQKQTKAYQTQGTNQSKQTPKTPPQGELIVHQSRRVLPTNRNSHQQKKPESG